MDEKYHAHNRNEIFYSLIRTNSVRKRKSGDSFSRTIDKGCDLGLVVSWITCLPRQSGEAGLSPAGSTPKTKTLPFGSVFVSAGVVRDVRIPASD